MARSLDQARTELRVRQGAGARYDAASAPARELDWARRGTAYFARMLNRLEDREIDEPSGVVGISRRRIVTYIGLEGRLLGEIIGWLRSRQNGPLPFGPTPSSARMADGVTLPVRALRNLFAHSAVHLDVEWRDLDDGQWDAAVECDTGEIVEVRRTPWQRAVSIWTAAIDLRAEGRFSDLPPELAASIECESTLRNALRSRFVMQHC